ncbi:hypothetical protein [Acinetobacter baumannii]|uniref:hypothetical protein n=1 Tax=Acinetobacter baumannii TaxID=470 RepID=UPI001248DBF8|nr:hypothetical protein [Acinetobacter baumannii]KAB1100105.1 hypothetical protein F6W73_11840 [Acinetobacter baumannii]MCV4241867.1 hypothetical protein [Acinetobacter baumannii]MDA4860819.1 hypothetical protein [Acinetobacter baumannii]
MTDLNKEREVNLRFEQDDGAVWVFDGDSQFGTEISHLMMMHSDEYNENELRVICQHAACEIDRLRAELEKAKAQAVPEWISTDFMKPDEGEAVLFIDKNNVIHDGYLNTDYVDGPYGENGEDFGDDQTLWASNSNGDEFLPSEIKYWMHRPSSPSASESGAEG